MDRSEDQMRAEVLLEKYLKGSASQEEISELQKMADAGLAEELALEIEAKANIRVAGEKVLREQLKDDWDELNVNKPNGSERRLWPRLAVAATVLILIGLFVFRSVSTQELNLTAYLDEPPTLLNRNNSANEFTQKWLIGERAYLEGDYEISQLAFRQLAQDSTADKMPGRLGIFQGLIAFQMQDYISAREYFLGIPEANPLRTEADWYLILVALADNRKDEARSALDQILLDRNHFRYEKARELRKLID